MRERRVGNGGSLNTMNNLPEVLVMEILSWLPAKSLFRFRCVSKSWLQLLTIDPHFLKLHLNQLVKSNTTTNTNPSIIVKFTNFYYSSDHESCDTAIEIDIPFKTNAPGGYRVSGVCNGLLCLTDSSHEMFTLWNPLTKDHITIPCSPLPLDIRDSGSDTVFGFGFHGGVNEFKVIRIVSTSHLSESEFQSHVSVYTLGTGSWRATDDVSYNISFDRLSPPLINGALHWFAAKPGLLFRNVIVSFDLRDEVFQEIPQPNGLGYGYPPDVAIGELGGLLCMYRKRIGWDIQIWVMKEYGVVDSWTQQFKIGRPQISGPFSWLKPLHVSNEGEIIIQKDSWGLILYDPRTKSSRNLKKFGFPIYDPVFDAYTFIGSIASPRLINGVGRVTDIEEDG